jgi:large conductance mechanosensitive channel
VLPLNKLHGLRKKGEVAEPEAPAEDVLVLQEIRDLLKAQNTNK